MSCTATLLRDSTRTKRERKLPVVNPAGVQRSVSGGVMEATVAVASGEIGVMLVRFDVQHQTGGWRVIDRITGLATSVDGVVAEHLAEEEAGEIADLLNTLEVLRHVDTLH